jgi:outer membrane protein OmpA-like peptidoglycan-associated protein
MKYVTLSATLLAFTLSACTTNPYTGESQVSKGLLGAGTGAAIGGAAGALLGATTSLKTRKTALIGAGIGALAGGGVGLYMDNQEAKLRQRLQNSGVSVTRVGDNIVLNMPSNVTFDKDQSDVKPAFYETLNSVAIVLQEYNQTLVDVVGHTDSDGSAEYNLELSRERAGSVARYLTSQQLDPNRFSVDGRGKMQPIASNATPAGKQKNRRVEITIQPLTDG